MSILVDKNTRLVVQGITGREGAFHTKQMIDYGTNVVAGVTPGKGGEWVFDTVPVFDTVKEAVDATGANTSIIYVPARFAADAIIEAAALQRNEINSIQSACFLGVDVGSHSRLSGR